jgi:hypothetical protein
MNNNKIPWQIVSGSTWAKEQAVLARRLRELETTYDSYLKSKHWATLLIKFKKSECLVCGSKFNLCLHHVTYVRLGYERSNDLVTLCNDCHFSIHEAAAKGPSSLDPRCLVPLEVRRKLKHSHNHARVGRDDLRRRLADDVSLQLRLARERKDKNEVARLFRIKAIYRLH